MLFFKHRCSLHYKEYALQNTYLIIRWWHNRAVQRRCYRLKKLPHHTCSLQVLHTSRHVIYETLHCHLWNPPAYQSSCAFGHTACQIPHQGVHPYIPYSLLNMSKLLQGASFSKNLKSSSDLSREKTMVTKVISVLKSVSRLKIFPETGPWTETGIVSKDFLGRSKFNQPRISTEHPN